jgi:hypothetical protein
MSRKKSVLTGNFKIKDQLENQKNMGEGSLEGNVT